MNGQYILRGHKPIPCHDLLTWGRWFEEANNRVVQQDTLPTGTRVSTVFLGLDHRYGEGPPLLFETIIFGGKHNDYQERYSTWDEAVEGHKKALALASAE